MATPLTDINLKSPTDRQPPQFGWTQPEPPPPYIHNSPYPMEYNTDRTMGAAMGHIPIQTPQNIPPQPYPPTSGAYPGSGCYHQPAQPAQVTIVTRNVPCHHDIHSLRRRRLLLCLPILFFIIAASIIISVVTSRHHDD
uniref:Extensin-like n=1 Tax=Panagrellus redivivus TaxID=6233 RepID=A0A7E4WDA5_PANRE